MPFDRQTINAYYKLESVNDERFYKFVRKPNYATIIRWLISDKVPWKLNASNQIINFPASGLSYMGKVWHRFISVKILPNGNISKVTKERVVLNYAKVDDIKFDVGMVIEISIWDNRGGKHNRGHPTLIFQLCKKVGVK